MARDLGQSRIDKEAVTVLHQGMTDEAARIHGELPKLGIEISQAGHRR
jgi:hypothetical protein